METKIIIERSRKGTPFLHIQQEDGKNILVKLTEMEYAYLTKPDLPLEKKIGFISVLLEPENKEMTTGNLEILAHKEKSEDSTRYTLNVISETKENVEGYTSIITKKKYKEFLKGDVLQKLRITTDYFRLLIEKAEGCNR